MKTYYVIRILKNGKKEKFFKGTFGLATSLLWNRNYFTHDFETLRDCEKFEDLILKHKFGREHIYKEVSKEEYEKALSRC
ncbi:hypothetical protein [Cetobacterium somerae]